MLFRQNLPNFALACKGILPPEKRDVRSPSHTHDARVWPLGAFGPHRAMHIFYMAFKGCSGRARMMTLNDDIDPLFCAQEAGQYPGSSSTCAHVSSSALLELIEILYLR